MSAPFGYIYHTFCVASGKHYVGQHRGTFNPSYRGSGQIIKQAIRKHGDDAFVVMLKRFCKTKAELDFHERKCISDFRKRLGRKNMYNIADGGGGAEGYKHSAETLEMMRRSRAGYRHSAETIAKLGAKARNRSADHQQKLTQASRNRSDAWRQKLRIASTGKHHSDETRARMRLAHKSRPAISEETKARRSKALQMRSPECYAKTWETRRKKYGVTGRR